jgi:hypothetical protein
VTPARLLVVLLIASLASATAEGSPRARCPRGHFRVEAGTRLIATGVAPTEAIVVEDGAVALSSGCAAVPARITMTRRGTTLRARWTDCHGRALKLRATISARTCTAMRGTLTVRGGHPRRRRFRAARAPFSYDVPLDPASPWPKFRRNSRQDGRSPVRPTLTGGHLWAFRTGKGVFS